MRPRVLPSLLFALVLLTIGGGLEPLSDDSAPEPLASRPAMDAAARAAGAGAGWWQTVSAAIERAEYEASPTATGLEAPNRAHDLRTTFAVTGIAVGPRQAKAVPASWRFGWQTARFGRADPRAPAGGTATFSVTRHDGRAGAL